MHSRIFGVQRVEGDAIPKVTDDPLDEGLYFGDDVSLAGKRFYDYVDPDTDPMKDAKWLQATLPVEIDEENMTAVITVTREMKRRYFLDQYRQFMDLTHDLDIDKFINDWKVYELESALDDNFGFHVNENGLDMSLDYFMRTAEDGKYAITGTLDYHF